MKKFLLPVTVGCFLFSGHSNAASVSAQVGKDFTELAAGIGSKATVLNSIFMEQRYDTTHPILGSF
ncbi:hypothetical protein [Arsenophonus sp. PmNCSU2021_1]|uniref:hypothetical protein n=1 Tax=Arsenophonus sp. PmNCSU2021_1 TaxID=3118989 RepID=UPI002FF18AD5